MQNETLIHNYRKSLEQKYNAVCFDIDGTLTMTNSKQIDNRAIHMISELLKRKIPVVFITGRGETGLNDLIGDIYSKLVNEFNLSINDLKRMYALTNDGARLFFTTENKQNLIFNNNVYVSTNYELEQLKMFNDRVIKELNDKSLYDFCSVTYSKDLKNETLLNVRVVFKNNNETLISNIVDIIKDVIKDYNLTELVVTRGIYINNTVIQIGTSKKEKAIERAEKIIGVPKNSMMRIGDCGDIRGNDYSMLNCEQGYSVDKTSESLDACFPIFNDNNEILKGVEATLFILKKAKLLPTVCLESAVKNNYSYNYAKVERDILKGRNKCLEKYNNIINNNFDTVNGIDDVFDIESGSVKIPMYEWELMAKNNPLKQLWNLNDDGKLLYSLRDNNNYLLRGSRTYYYLLANRRSDDGKDYTSFEDVINWYNNNLGFIINSLKALNISNNFNDITSKKMLLGILDNVRNILLILINHNINSKYFFDNVLIKLNSSDDQHINNLYETLYYNNLLMSKMCFTNSQINIEEIIELLKLVYNLLDSDLLKFKVDIKDKDYSKEFRAYREIDNFAQNYIAIKLNDEKLNQNSDVAACGMCYGGLELPIIYKIINPKLEDILLLKFNKDVSGYANKQLVELRKFNINNFGGLLKIGEFNNKNFVLLDDNILTGKTMQLAVNCLYDENINVKKINIVRYPSINRVDQMFLNNHGAVDYNLFFEYITGLCFHSPYSWRDENEYDLYLDSLGVFDLNRKKILECIIKNHDYKEYSEVYNYIKKIRRQV